MQRFARLMQDVRAEVGDGRVRDKDIDTLRRMRRLLAYRVLDNIAKHGPVDGLAQTGDDASEVIVRAYLLGVRAAKEGPPP